MKFSTSLVFAVALAQDSSVISVDTRLVQFNVVVSIKNGLVAGLKKEDFIILDRGKPRPISLFQVVDSRATPATESSKRTPPTEAGSPNTYSNRASLVPNATIVLFDAINTAVADQAYARLQIIKLLEHLRPTDSLAIYTLDSKGLHIAHDFSSDTGELIAAVKALRPVLTQRDSENSMNDQLELVKATMPHAAALIGMVEEMNANLRRMRAGSTVKGTEAAMIEIAHHFASVPGRKSLVWISAGFPIATASPQDHAGFNQNVQNASRSLMDSNVVVYPVDASGLTGASIYHAQAPTSHEDRRSVTPAMLTPIVGSAENETMKIIADQTGGKAFYNMNGVEGAIRHAIDDAQLTYTLGFYLPQNEIDSKFHETTITVAQHGLTVQARKGYYAYGRLVQSPSVRTQIIEESVKASIDSTALPLTMRIDPVAGSNSVHILCSIQPTDLSFVQQQGKMSASVDLVLVQRASDGSRLNVITQAFALNYTPERYQEVLTNSITWEKTIDLAPQANTIRVVVFDRNSSGVGSVSGPARGTLVAQQKLPAN
jgi:VWFA-related protein